MHGRRIKLGFVLLAALLGAYAVAGGGWLGYHFLKDYIGIAHSLLNPNIIETATPSAKSYVGSLVTDVSVVDSNPAVVTCTIRNVGSRPIRQMTIRINLRDRNGNIQTWREGPVIRGYAEEGFSGATHTSQQLNSFSEFWAPFSAGRRILFRSDFPAYHPKNEPLFADMEVLDIDFMAGGNGP
jgi:hypothetical protein